MSSGLIKDLITFIYHLNELRCSHRPIDIGRGAITSNAGKANAVKVKDGARYKWCQEGQRGGEFILDHRVRAILVVIRNLRVLRGLVFLLELEGPSLRHIAEWRGDVVLIGGTDDRLAISMIWCRG